MNTYSRSHLSDASLLHDLAAHVAGERTSTAVVLADIAEVDARKLYLPAAYPSMFAYCVGELRLSEDAAAKRIQAARVARRFPAIFAAVAEGRLHLSGVVLLAPYLREETVEALLATATHKTKAEIERLLAERFPRPDVFAWVEAVSPQHAPGHAGDLASQVAPAPSAPGRIENQQVSERSRFAPLSALSVAVQFTLSRSDHDMLRYAQALLGHQVPSGDIGAVVVRALKTLIPTLERAKFAATARPRGGKRGSSGKGRYIPREVRRAVWERDGGQCTFISESGHRCEAREPLEFDHIEPVARGGQATVEGMRLCCRAHNQYEAERMFGAGFMQEKRTEARRAAETRRASSEVRARAAAEARASADTQQARDVLAALRELGYRAEQARRAVEFTEDLHDATLEQRVRAALRYLCPKATRRAPAPLDASTLPGGVDQPAQASTN